MILRLLGPFGIAGAALSLALGLLLGVQKMETRHWHKQSDQYQALYIHEHETLLGTVANYRAAAKSAEDADKANAERVKGLQDKISKEQSDEYQKRIAAARARAERLRAQNGEGSSDPCGSGAKGVPSVPAPASGPAEAACKDRLPTSDALAATEQAIQLDELIKWVKRVAGIDVGNK